MLLHVLHSIGLYGRTGVESNCANGVYEEDIGKGRTDLPCGWLVGMTFHGKRKPSCCSSLWWGFWGDGADILDGKW